MHLKYLPYVLCGLLPFLKAEEVEGLSPRQQAWVDAVFEAGVIVDPIGATRVMVLTPRHFASGNTHDHWKEAWLFPAKDGNKATIVGTSGIPIPKERQKDVRTVSFLQACRAKLVASILYEHDLKEDDWLVDTTLRGMQEGARWDDPYILAAWLTRRGEVDLAKQLFEYGYKFLDMTDLNDVTEEVAASVKLDMIHAYAARDDKEAERQAAWLKERFPHYAKAQRTRVEKELTRRKEQDRYGKKVDLEATPKGYDQWPAEQQAAYWIDLLDEGDEEQDGQPGGVDLGAHITIRKLVEIGDPALPALLDTLETDHRLTRSVHYWRVHHPSRTILTVREAALVAIMDILQEDFFFELASTGDSFSSRGDAEAKKVADQIRAYLTKWGHLPFPERMVAQMEDDTLSDNQRRGALVRLCYYGSPVQYGTMFGVGDEEEHPRKGLHPDLARIQDPPVLTRVLQFMEADLKAQNKRDHAGRMLWYLELFDEIGERNILDYVPTFWTGTTHPHDRLELSLFAKRWGDSSYFETWLNEFREGEILLDGNDAQKRFRLKQYLNAIRGHATPEQQTNTFTALAKPEHPIHQQVPNLPPEILEENLPKNPVPFASDWDPFVTFDSLGDPDTSTEDPFGKETSFGEHPPAE